MDFIVGAAHPTKSYLLVAVFSVACFVQLLFRFLYKLNVKMKFYVVTDNKVSYIV